MLVVAEPQIEVEPKILVLFVTQELIDKSRNIKRNAQLTSMRYDCPIALAFNEAMGSGYCDVGHTIISYYDNFRRCSRSYEVTEEMRYFITRFDAGMQVEPMVFTVELPK